jgi:hypothetical protein
MTGSLPPDWESQVARAYATFGVDPLGTEFGFKFTVGDLRRWAMDRLRIPKGDERGGQFLPEPGAHLPEPVERGRIQAPDIDAWEPPPQEWTYEQLQWETRHRGTVPDISGPLDRVGATAPPTLLSKEGFGAAEGFDFGKFGWKDPRTGVGDVLYRGKAGSGTPADQVMASIQKAPANEHYIGAGIFGSGLYFGGSNDGLQYSRVPLQNVNNQMVKDGDLPVGPDGAVIRAKLSPDAKVVTKEELQKMYTEWQEWVESTYPFDERQKFLKEYGMNLGDIGVFAALQGIDAVVNDVQPYNLNVVVTNRAKLIMEELGLKHTPPPPRPR